MLYVAAIVLGALVLAHAYLGERFILIRLFRRGDLPKVLGDTAFTKGTLRFIWHLATLQAWTVGVLLVWIAAAAPPASLACTIGWALLAAGLLPLWFTRGRHLSWLFMFAAGGLCLAWAAA